MLIKELWTECRLHSELRSFASFKQLLYSQLSSDRPLRLSEDPPTIQEAASKLTWNAFLIWDICDPASSALLQGLMSVKKHRASDKNFFVF